MNINEKIREFLYSDENVINQGKSIIENGIEPNETLTKLIDKYGEFYVCDFNRIVKEKVQEWFEKDYTENGEINMDHYRYFDRVVREEINFRNLMALDYQMDQLSYDVSKCTKQELDLIKGIYDLKKITVFEGKETHNFGWERAKINDMMSELLGCCTLQHAINVHGISVEKEDKDEGR